MVSSQRELKNIESSLEVAENGDNQNEILFSNKHNDRRISIILTKEVYREDATSLYTKLSFQP